jgi:hypothetical protein
MSWANAVSAVSEKALGVRKPEDRPDEGPLIGDDESDAVGW